MVQWLAKTLNRSSQQPRIVPAWLEALLTGPGRLTKGRVAKHASGSPSVKACQGAAASLQGTYTYMQQHCL